MRASSLNTTQSNRRPTTPPPPTQQVNDICARARAAQQEWAKTSFAERRRVLATMQAYIVEHMEDIARVCSRDSGKPSELLVGWLSLE